MRCHVLNAPGDLSLIEVPDPSPRAGEVVVRVRAALTCGTDIKAFARGHPKWPMPTRFGHEFAGVIAAVGRDVQDWRVGDEVMAAPTAPCGRCFYCERGQENLCDSLMETMVLGAYGEFVTLPERIVRQNLFHKHPSLSFAEAALMEPLACVLHGLETQRIDPTTIALLIGAGPISLLHVRALRILGAQRIIVIARNPNRAAAAMQLGADDVIIGDLGSVRDRVLKATHERGADLVIECTGQAEVWESAPSLARRGGHVILFGGCPSGSTVAIDTYRMHYDQVAISSPFHFTPRAVRRSWEMLGHPAFGAADFISATLPLAELGTALERHRMGMGIKFAIEP